MTVSEELIVENRRGVGHLLLNRPKALNAVTRDQVRALHARLDAWAADESVQAVLIEGEGEKAFSAGGDIRAIYDARQNGDREFLYGFYYDEYRCNRAIFRFPKPYIALMDGVVMGGGVGISIHGSHRISTERMVFAMPETGVGLFPDVGGSHFLPRCPGEVGTYLGLTGVRIRPGDALYAGLTTHHVTTDRLPDLRQALTEADYSTDALAAATWILDNFHVDAGASHLAEHREAIDRCFCFNTVEEILDALHAEDSEFARKTLDVLAGKSPTSLKVTLRQLRAGKAVDFETSMQMEYRLATRFMEGHDFFEGVRALIVDKDQNPQWRPDTLAAVEPTEVDAYFKPLEEIAELTFD